MKQSQHSDSQDPFQNKKNNSDNPTKLKISLVNKINSTQFDDKQTKKKKTDSFSQMCEKILSEKKKMFKEQLFNQRLGQVPTYNQDDDIFIIDPHIVHGVVENFQQTIQKEKLAFGLQTQGKCQHFTLNNEYLIVLIGRIPTPYPNGISISLYLPRSMIQKPIKKYNNLSIVTIQRKVINNDQNFFNYPFVIVQPQFLLYPTYLCSWIDCKRRISLVNYITCQFQVNQNLVYGSACHRYMQWLIQGEAQIQNRSYSQFKQVAKRIYMSFLYDMYLIKSSFDAFFKYCQQSLINIRLWVKNHVLNKKQIQLNKYQKIYLVIDQIVGSEMMHRSKYFGLKGKMDCLFKGFLINKIKNTKTQVYIPFQLKTGKKPSQSHKKQTDIYNLLIRQQYKKDVIGLLYYSDFNKVIERYEKVQIVWQNLIVHRNTILINLSKLYKTQKISLSSFTSNLDVCKMCNMASQCEVFYISNKIEQDTSNRYKEKYSQSTVCSTNNKLSLGNQSKSQINTAFVQSIFESEDQDQVPSKYNSISKEKIDKMSSNQFFYLITWFKWLHYQERQNRIANDKYLKSGFTSFNLKYNQLNKIKNLGSGVKLRIWIQKSMRNLQQLNQILNFYQVSQKIRILINPLNIIEGCKITKIKKKELIIQNVFKRLFYVQVEFNVNGEQLNQKLNKKCLEYSIQEKVDLNVELEKFQSQGYSNLRNTMSNFVLGKSNQRLLRLILVENETIIQNKKPIFNQENFQQKKQDQNQLKDQQKQQIIINESDLLNLNINQQTAFRSVFRQNQYCTLVQGMPGTGKTQLIVRLIQKCSLLNWKVLITTFTNRSLDNILQRTFKSNRIQPQKIIREGSRYSIDQKYQNLNSRGQIFETIQDYQQYYNSKNLWFVTLASMGIHHIPQKFDLVILDQASQSLEPACIQALIKGERIVLIGDYKQLQPIVKSKKAQKQGMSVSLFQKLCYKYPQKSVSLKLQYRMNKQIMKISNKLVYEEQLQIGSQTVGNKTLKLKQNWDKQCFNQKTLISTLHPQNSIIFLNHDGITNSFNSKYRSQQQYITNILQVQISVYLLKKLVLLGIPKQQITIVCVYNRTVDQLTKLLRKSQQYQKNSGQVLTIDKSQGIDKEVIILLAQSRRQGSTNNILLQNSRRLNVALTRAKSKLIVIGSKNYLSEMEVWNGGLSQILNQHEKQIKKQFIDHVIQQFQQDQNQEIKDKNNKEQKQQGGQQDLSDSESYIYL